MTPNDKLPLQVVAYQVAAIVLSLWLGWAYAHSVVATECQRLGAFYVGGTTFKCEVLK